MEQLKQCVTEILTPIREDLFEAIMWYNGTLSSCGYAASIITKLLQQKMPSDQVRIGYGYKGSELNLKYHFWTEIKDKVFVDATYGQYAQREIKNILVEDMVTLERLDLKRLDRKKPEEFSQVITDGCGKQTVLDLIAKPDEPFIPGFQFIWEPYKRKYTLDTIERLEQKLGIRN